MKKFLKIFILLVIVAIAGGAIYLFYIAPTYSFQSIYLVPENAVYIIETERPFDAWDKIVHSQTWNYMKSNKLLSEINKDIEKADSMVNSNRFLLKMFGSRKILISSHPYKTGKYEFLYVVDLKKTSKLTSVNKYLDRVLGKDFRLTRRDYKDQEIFELYDKTSKELYYFSFIKNQFIFSQVASLIEASVDQLDDLTIGRDLNYTEVARKTEGRGLFSVCINYSFFKDYITSVLGKPNDFISNLSKNLYYTAAYFDLDKDGQLKIEGYTSLKDTNISMFSALTKSGKGPQDVMEITPQRTASVTNIGFEDINTLYGNFYNTLNETTQESVRSSIEKLEKRLKINFEENFFGWMDDEIALVQTQPSNLGRQNEFAVVIKAKSEEAARENLYFLANQMKKNSPVKFHEINYKEYSISYLHIPGIMKFLFGKLLQRLEKPYFAVIDNWVVFSNHPQTIKSIIDDYAGGKTIKKSSEKNNFTSLFPNKSVAFVYLQTPVLFGNMKEFVSPSTWVEMNENKKYFESFSDIGIHIDTDDELLKIEIIAKFNPSFEKFNPVNYSSTQNFLLFEDSLQGTVPEEEETFEPEIAISDLDASKHEEFYEDGAVKMEVELKRGLKHGTFKEYYPDGTLKIRGKYKNDIMDGTWKYYDEKGELNETKEFENGELKE